VRTVKAGVIQNCVLKVKAGVNPPDKAHIPEARDQKTEEKIPAGAGSTNYAFESGVIRLNQRDFEQWQQLFKHIDVPAELLGLSPWAETQGKNWFHAVKGALIKRNREVKANKEKSEQQPFKWNGGMEGVL
jgi:hypothetical protein